MNVQQLTQQLVAILSPQNFFWPDPPSEPVLARVGVVPGQPDFFSMDAAAPFALIHPEAARDHPEHPADLVEEARWSIYLFAANATDQAGGAGIVGGNRTALGSSIGRGVLEVEPRVQSQILSQLGLTARPRAIGAQAPGVSGKLPGLVADRALDVVATRIPKQPDWAPVTKLLASSGGGTVTLTWTLPRRFDLIRVVVRRGAANGAAPPDPFSGASVPVTGIVETITDTPGAGTWAYSVWAAYDATIDPATGNGAESSNRYSGYFHSVMPPAPAAPPPASAFSSFSGNITAGVHSIYITFLSGTSESPLSAPKVLTFSGTRDATVTLPIGPPGTTGRRVYMTLVGGTIPYLLAVSTNNTDTLTAINGSDAQIPFFFFGAYKPNGFTYSAATVSATV